MGMLGTFYHGTKAIYEWLADDSDALSHELDKALDSLHRTVSLDPVGISDVSDIVDDIAGDN